MRSALLSRVSRAARASASSRRFASDLPSYVLNAPSTEVSSLRNGVRVASEVRRLPAARPPAR